MTQLLGRSAACGRGRGRRGDKRASGERVGRGFPGSVGGRVKGGDERREVKGWGEVTKEGVTKRERKAECVTVGVNKRG